MSEVAKTYEHQMPAQQAQETSAVLNMIERVAMDPNSDLAKLEKMLDMQERVLNRNAQQAFSADMALMQSELPRVVKSRQGHNSKYAPLEDINDAIRPALQKYGFAVTFGVEQLDAGIKIVTHLSHRQGHREETSIVLPAETSGSKNSVQAVGSSISYGKRYGICAILNISTGDDTDGEAPKTQDNSANKITKNQTFKLMEMITAAGITVEKFCETARVDSVHDLEKSRFVAAKNRLQKAIDANKGAAK